jgi:hypothetical protein
MKIYIAGKFTGLDYNKAYSLFAKAEKQLLTAGHDPVNPLKHISKHAQWEAAMKVCLTLLMECQGIFLLDNWKDSPGAMLEFYIASRLRYEIFNENDLHHLSIINNATLNY